MYKVIVKFNNGSSSIFSYPDEKIVADTLTTDIGHQLYPDKYNSKINQYIKLIYMGKIIGIDEEIIFDSSKSEQMFHCVIKKIPDEAFIIEKSKTVELHEVTQLLADPKFIELISQRTIFEFLVANLNSHEKVIDIINGNTSIQTTNNQELLITKYSQQIKVLKEMGFGNDNELAVLLGNANGNLENVINLLMS